MVRRCKTIIYNARCRPVGPAPTTQPGPALGKDNPQQPMGHGVLFRLSTAHPYGQCPEVALANIRSSAPSQLSHRCVLCAVCTEGGGRDGEGGRCLHSMAGSQPAFKPKVFHVGSLSRYLDGTRPAYCLQRSARIC